MYEIQFLIDFFYEYFMNGRMTLFFIFLEEDNM